MFRRCIRIPYFTIRLWSWKKAGEFYTPQEVSSILSKIVTTGKDRLESVYDPTWALVLYCYV